MSENILLVSEGREAFLGDFISSSDVKLKIPSYSCLADRIGPDKV